MGRFGSRVGVVEALGFATGVQLLLVSSCCSPCAGTGGLAGAFKAPAWMWAGGAMGCSSSSRSPSPSPGSAATTTIGILIAGQLVMGALIDHFGWFGVDQIALSWTRRAGIVVPGAGAAPSLAK